MTLKPLTTAQQDQVNTLVGSGRLTAVAADDAVCLSFLQQARDLLSDAPHVRTAAARYDLAYDAAHAVGEALLKGYGYRTVNGPGQHVALGQFLEAVFDVPPPKQAAQRFEQMRTSRNGMIYRAHTVTTAEATLAEQTARTLLDAADGRLEETTDQSGDGTAPPAP